MSDFKEFERLAWEDKAPRYEDTWGRVSSQAFDTIVSLAKLGPGRAFLDIGCGPGDLCARARETGATVTGCDYSQRMLEIARDKNPGIDFRHEDAENLGFAADSFDAVALNYLLLHVADQERALREGARVLRRGGRLIFTMWLPPAESAGLALIFGAIKKYADTSVIPPAQDVFLFADRERAAAFFDANGFSDTRFERLENRWKVDSPEEFFAGIQAGTRMGGTIDLQQPAVKEQIRQHIFAELDQFRAADGSYVVLLPSLVAAGTKS